MKIKIFLAILIFVVIIIGAWFLYPQIFKQNQTVNQNQTASPKPVNQVRYVCKDNKTIEASFYAGPPPAVKPGEPPTPNGSVDLILSDGRHLSLPQTISGSGIRYANSDESIIFWSEGNGAFMLETNQQTYIGCIVVIADPGNLPQIYADSSEGFSIRYPADYSLNTNYFYQALGPNKKIGGVKLTIPAALATGTNLSGYDTGVSVEKIPNIQDCNASLFVYPGTKATSITDAGVEYSIATTTDAGAGNFYEEKVWAFPGTNPCIAIRYFIHSTNIYNYTPGTVREFDRNALLEQFDAIRRTLILL